MSTIQNICKAAENRGYSYKIQNYGQNGNEVFLFKMGGQINIRLKGKDRKLQFNFKERANRPDKLYATSDGLGFYTLQNFNGQLLSEEEVISFINAN